jgi:hypothetical protein
MAHSKCLCQVPILRIIGQQRLESVLHRKLDRHQAAPDLHSIERYGELKSRTAPPGCKPKKKH